MKAAVASACRALAEEGLVLGTAGNVSTRAGDLITITATGAKFSTISADEVTVVDLDGNVVDGELAPTSELAIHLGIYRATDAGAIVHTHATTCVAVGCVVDELPCVHYQMLAFGGAVRVAPYKTFGTQELADAVLVALEGKSAALMANHGAITYGATLDAAMDSARLLEWASTVYLRAASMGTVRALGDEALAAVVATIAEQNYGTTRRA
ncbi:class II aldolase/adducin family protein [Antrihabitans sp. YC2-6]|uniref:class II aldolase/adducin family protein n=1 Tax=Antrihabitans sp. YC2-6 TaxID=2799498 RepID=UPI0018F42DDD|nr:class II aldolase/adducin family protein [Antrihabitans sp. YC2-6]MBJ8346586.1 class II aldolase/adducin family protein [Antrihabitans sp. YC2-6]